MVSILVATSSSALRIRWRSQTIARTHVIRRLKNWRQDRSGQWRGYESGPVLRKLRGSERAT